MFSFHALNIEFRQDINTIGKIDMCILYNLL